MANADNAVCPICDSVFLDEDQRATVGSRGLQNLIASSIERGDGKHAAWVNLETLVVHVECRASYINKRLVEVSKKRRLSSDSIVEERSTSFDYEHLCIICALPCSEKFEVKKPKKNRRKIRLITEDSNFKKFILEACSNSTKDSIAEVAARLNKVDNLHSVGARFHHACDVNFLNELKLKGTGENMRNTHYQLQFEKLFDFMENSEDLQWTWDEIMTKLSDSSPSENYVRKILNQRYGNDIMFHRKSKDKTIVILRGFGKDIGLDYFKENIPVLNEDEKKCNTLKLAAKYIREDIRAMELESEYYPPTNGFFTADNISDVVPESLTSLLSDIILPQKKDIESYKKKITSISHAIITATRPKSFISSLQLALSIYIHSKHQSKLLINILHRLGLCASYDETLLYEGSAVMSSIPTLQASRESFVQYVFDNADYDTCTIDGKNTFHYTGGVQCITPASSTALNLSIKRVNPRPRASEIASKFKVKIYDYTVPETRGLQQLKIKDIRALRSLESDKTHFLPGELLWTTGHLLKVPGHPGWSGFMELRTNSTLYEVSKIKYLPFIYLKATDESAIFSAMMFGLKESKKVDQKNVFFTFDQQLYIKAREILADIQFKLVPCDENMDHVFIRLGGFHLIMSFLGCIGKIMDGSGLKEVWCSVYAEKSTEKMLSGKNYARAVRAHYYTQAALMLIVLDECAFTATEKNALERLLSIEPLENEFKRKSNEQTVLEKLEKNSVVQKFMSKIKFTMNSIAERGKTAMLWIQYIKMVSLFRSFIQAERSGNFDLHLSTIIEMIPFFHSCNHFKYAKSAHLYVQDHLDLEKKMASPKEFKRYVTDGYFTIRRSDKFFSGVSTDMIVEQTMMRSIHSIGGLVHGRGITESVAASWLNTLSCSAYINDDLEKFCTIESTFSDQHKDFRDSAMYRDSQDLKIIRKWFKEHPPFISTDQIVSLSTGVTGGLDVNCYNAEYIGLQSYNKLIPSFSIEPDGSRTINEKNFGSVKFNHELQVIPLSVSKGSIKIGQNKVPIDEKILFNRFEKSEQDPKDFPKFFEHELCPYPVSIFATPITIRTALKDDFFSFFKESDKPNNEIFAVIDGETLLTLISWSINCSYRAVYEQYVHFLQRNYGSRCVIVFDSMMNDVTAIKVSEKLLTISATSVATEIYFDETKCTTKKRDMLFQNHKNKCRFIEQLIGVLTCSGLSVKLTQQSEDVNNVIVEEALNHWRDNCNTVIISNNVNILCLLAARSSIQKNIYFNIPGKIWYSSTKIQQQFQSLSPYLHVIRALTGTDVTSCFFNVSKKNCIKSFLKKQEEVSKLLQVFTLADSAIDIPNLVTTGEKLIMLLYNVSGKNLNEVRCQKYLTSLKTSRKTNFNVASLPPTSAAAMHHSLRVYWLIQRWQNNILPSLLWGWTIVHQTLVVPIATTLPPVPDDLLNLIICGCKKGCKSKTCSCVKSGLLCSNLCRECNDFCVNKPMVTSNWTMSSEDENSLDSEIFTMSEGDPTREAELEADEAIPGSSWM